MDRVRVVPASAAGAGEVAGSLSRLTAIDEPRRWAGLSTVAVGSSTGGHHHGSNTTVFYMLAGSLMVEHGEDPVESARASGGDFVVVPARVEHREIVEGDEAIEAVVVRLGDGLGPLVVEVDRTGSPAGS